MKMLLKTKYEKIFVYCPAHTVTGGPDALHQLTFYLNLIGCDAEIVYFIRSVKNEAFIPEPYQKYVTSFRLEEDVCDDPRNAVIIPEFAVEKAKKFKKSKVFIWWLSVDNNRNRRSFFWKFFYFATLPSRIVVNFDYYKSHFVEAIKKTISAEAYSFVDEQSNIEHMCASFYAYRYVKSKTKNYVHLCIEPISKIFLEKFEELRKCHFVDANRSNEILYNPKKSGVFVKKIAKKNADLKFIPLEGLNQKELIEKYKSAKLYIDFGPFPGAERMPKEAVLFGCAVITGRNGASSIYEDVPIPDSYKFESESKYIPDIVKKIEDVLDNFEQIKKDFDVYRKTVLDLETRFVESLKGLFV